MQCTKTVAATVLLACLALAGCESKQQRTAKLQAEYDAAAKQYVDSQKNPQLPKKVHG